jgi:2-keto-3-deoxy-L-rhamnonate aldolase RhmA
MIREAKAPAAPPQMSTAPGARNRVKEAAASGERIRGIHLTFAAPSVIEVLASANLHFVYIDGEHGCFDWRDVEAACITAERHDLTPIARIPDLSSATITRFLDRGVRGLVLPHVESVDAAETAIDAAYFAPAGSRSFGAGRPEYGQRIGHRPTYMQSCNAAISVCVMIESQHGLDVAADVAALKRVDYLSFGMLDLAQSLGHPGDPAHADVKAAVASCIERIHAAGKRVREDFMNYVWINDVLITGARQLLDPVSPDSHRTSAQNQPYGMSMTASGGGAND